MTVIQSKFDMSVAAKTAPAVDGPERGVPQFLEYLDEMVSLLEAAAPLYGANPHIRMSIELLRRHFQSKITQPSLLIDVSGVPYATATRRLNELIASGLIERRAKSKTERSFTLHPSDSLLSKWSQMAKDHLEILSDSYAGSITSNNQSDRFYGSAYFSEKNAPPLNVLSKPLTLSGGLRLLTHSDPSFLVMNNLRRHFEVVVGCPIHHRSYSLDKLYDEAVLNAARDRSAHDLVSINLPWVGEFAEKGLLLALDDIIDIERLDPTDFHPASWKACHWNGKCYGIPVETTCEVLMYRSDLFYDKGFLPPKTTNELLSIAKAFHDPKKQMYGIAWNAARGTALGHTFMMAMADFGQPIIDLEPDELGFSTSELSERNYNAMIDSEGGLKAAEFLLELMKYSAPGVLTMSWYERTRAYAQGKVAMAYGFTQMSPYFEQDENSPAFGNTGYIPHPAGEGREPISPVGGFILGIPSNLNERRVRDVSLALETFTSARAQTLYVESGSRGVSRYSASEDPRVRTDSPVIEVIDELSRQGALQSWPRPPIPEVGSITQVCGIVMHEMLRGIITPREALVRAQEGAQQIIENWKVQ